MNLMEDGSKIKADRKKFNDIDIYYLRSEYKKKITDCDEINSASPLYLRITDMKGKFKKGKDDNVRYLIIYGEENVLKIFANIWKSIRAKIKKIRVVLYNMIKITWEKNLRAMIICQQIILSIFA